jgi:hypothetical protein
MPAERTDTITLTEITDTCVCGGSRSRPNRDCERCQLIAEIDRLRARVARLEAIPASERVERALERRADEVRAAAIEGVAGE